jgi:hypothetical protein
MLIRADEVEFRYDPTTACSGSAARTSRDRSTWAANQFQSAVPLAPHFYASDLSGKSGVSYPAMIMRIAVTTSSWASVAAAMGVISARRGGSTGTRGYEEVWRGQSLIT